MKNMSVSYAPNKLRVPPGFQALLEGLAREVLREQPHDCVDFCAKYFRNLVEQRESEYLICVCYWNPYVCLQSLCSLPLHGFQYNYIYKAVMR